MTRLVTYTVRGVFTFPIDMLRYDCAWPYEERDAALIHDSLDLHTRRKATDRFGAAPRPDPYIIRIQSTREPTDARWASFGWKVER